MKRELAVIIPVYNESGAIEEVLLKWVHMLRRSHVSFTLEVYNDGSTDDTALKLEQIAKDHPEIRVHNKANEGHGPTILRGYLNATEASWIFQVDSDDETPASEFHSLWENREDKDFLIGIRKDRGGPLSRRFISWVSRATVQGMFGGRIQDVNCPFRLMRQSTFENLFQTIPKNTLAPNVLISGIASLLQLRVYQCPVVYQTRRTGVVSIRHWKLARTAIRSWLQTVTYFLASRSKLASLRPRPIEAQVSQAA